MSSEEMRNELEAFVNTGLRKGWHGWPLKEESRMSRTLGLSLHAELVRIQHGPGSGWITGGGWPEALRVARCYFSEN